MKTLTVKQPWASLIVAGIKDIENRTWATKYRGPLMIHAGAKESGSLYELLNYDQRAQMHQFWDADLLPFRPLSAIVGQIDVVDCVINHPSVWADNSHIDPYDTLEADNIIYNWVLANPVQFDEPILNVKGKLSFWEWEVKS